jgi:NADPH:quinone reductase-like Zn-dependent oxidoreductase
LVAKLGGEPIDYRNERFEEAIQRRTEGNGVVAAFDPIGGWHWLRSRRCVRRGGTVVAFGSQAAGKMEDAAAAVVSVLWPGRRFTFYSVTGVKKRHPAWFREDLAMLVGLLVQRRIAPIIGARLPWQKAAEANRMLEEGSVQGKIVLLFE